MGAAQHAFFGVQQNVASLFFAGGGICFLSTFFRKGEKKLGPFSCIRRTKGSLLTVFFFAFSRKFHELQQLMSRFTEYFPPRQNTAKLIRELQTKARLITTSGRRTV